MALLCGNSKFAEESWYFILEEIIGLFARVIGSKVFYLLCESFAGYAINFLANYLKNFAYVRR